MLLLNFSFESIWFKTEKITDESKPPLNDVPILRSASNLNFVAS